MKYFWMIGLITVTTLLAHGLPADEVPEWLNEGAWTRAIWPDGAPGETRTVKARLTEDKGGNIFRVIDVAKPTLTFFPTPGESAANPAVLICPGGGYHILAINHEGTEVAQWLNSLGVSAFVLQYRVPKQREGAIQDAQRALRVIRANATEWKVNPEKLGILGFSAGGHLSARTSGAFETSTYEAVDQADEQSARPDFAVLIYPAYLVNQKTLALMEPIEVGPDNPPVFLTHAEDDKGHIRNSLGYYWTCLETGVPAEMHLYPQGGHGYGMRPGKRAAEDWPKRCGEWLKAMGFAP